MRPKPIHTTVVAATFQKDVVKVLITYIDLESVLQLSNQT